MLASSCASMLVRTVTARRRGEPGVEAAMAAADIMAAPPEAWMVRREAPACVAERTAPATVLGMS